MNNEKKSSAPNLIIGIVLLVVGLYITTSVKLEFVEALNKQGIPLDPGMTLATIGVFLILFKVFQTFFFNDLSAAISGRTTELEKTFSEAENLRSEMSTMRSEYEARLAATEASAREQIQAQIKEAQALRQTLMAEANSQAQELIRKAQHEIATEREKVLTDLRVHVVNLSLGAAEKVVGANMNTDLNKKLVDEFIDKVGVEA